MADYDLEAMSLSELKKMQKDIAKAISTFEDRQKAEARAKAEALARDLGYYLAEPVGTETKFSSAAAATKYRHPENPGLTWSGHLRLNRAIPSATIHLFRADRSAIHHDQVCYPASARNP